MHIFYFFIQKKISETYTIISLTFQVSKIDLKTFLAQLVSILRVTLQGVVMRRKMCFYFWALLLKMYIFEVVTFFSCLVVIQSTQFFNGSVVVNI